MAPLSYRYVLCQEKDEEEQENKWPQRTQRIKIGLPDGSFTWHGLHPADY